MSVVEKLQIDYDYLIEYLEDAMNAIGATTSTTLRNITAHNDGNSIYVRKFGADYAITDITNAVINTPRSDGGGVNTWQYDFEGWNGTAWVSMGDVTDDTGASVFNDGPAFAATKIRIVISHLTGTVTITDGDTITLTTNVGVLTVHLSGETFSTGSLTLYLSYTGSTYYDENYMYGGFRHVPDSTSLLPYFDITTAIADPDATGFTITTVLDSAIYDEQPVISIAGMILQADEGQTPRITSGVGARVTREVEHDGNNSDTAYVGKTGNDANSGTFQEPYLTLAGAITGIGARTHINIMDDGIYEESALNTGNINIESIYNKTPILKNTNILLGAFISTGDNYLHGVQIDAGYCLYAIFGNFNNTNIEGCTIYNFTQFSSFAILGCNNGVKANLIYNGQVGIANCFIGAVENNIIYNLNGDGTSGIGINILFTSGTFSMTIRNNLIYNCKYGIKITIGVGTANGSIENNTIIDISLYHIDFSITSGGTNNLTIRNMITWGDDSDFHLRKTGTGANPTITYSDIDQTKVDSWTIGAGSLNNEDPKFCKESLPYKYGISSDSPCYRTDASSDDMGAHLRIIELNASTIEINGFNIDGQDQYNNAVYILDSADHIGCSLKWCSVYDFQGIEFDPYDDDTNTDCTVSNCEFYNGGNGIKLSYGGNTLEENLIYNNAVYGIHSDHTGQTFNHNSIYGNQHGIYFESNSGGIIIKNSIFHGNSLRGIYSEVNISITYCCITDGTNNVDITDESNTTDNPLFLNELPGSEDFNIKTTFGGFNAVSPCYLASSDSPVKDIGAYDVERSIAEEGWKKYVLYSNPANMNIDNNAPGQVRFKDARGSSSLWAEAHKLVFPMEWEENTLTNEEQKDKIKYISTIIQKREGRNPRTKIQSRLRLNIKPTGHLENGTNGIVDASNKKLTDTAMLLTEDKFKGYNMAVIYASGTGLVVDSVAKTGTKGGAGWTINQWRGFYFKYNGYTYFIKSNTATVLTLSDPYSTLISATVPYSFEKYFEIEEHDDTGIFYLIDDNDELVDGTYAYYMTFAVTRIMDSAFGYKQPKFAYDKPEWMSGYSLIMEQV